MTVKKYNIVLVSLCCTLFVFSQKGPHKSSSQDRKDLKLAEIAFERADYLKSFSLYSSLIKKDSTNSDLWFKAGASLFNMNKMDTACVVYFERTKSKVPESHYYLGKVYLLSGRAKEAIDEFESFKRLNNEESVDNADVTHWIKICESAVLEQSKKGSLVVRNMGNVVNSEFADYVPLMWNFNALIFTSRRSDSKGGSKDPYGRYYEDIYFSKKEENGWSKPASLSDEINTNGHDACVALSPSGNELIIYRTDEKQTGGDLYLCTYDGTKWGAPVKMGPEINSPYLEASACFSSDGNEIVFSSNRPGGFGGRDLYRIRRFMNGKYSLPYNLGPAINTADDEDAPFVDKDNVLYFSSKGHNSIGEYDIFKSEFNAETMLWNTPQNMGIPINSTNDDIYFMKLDDAQTAMFTSRRPGGFGDADLYQVNFTESTEMVVYCKLTTVIDKSELKDIQLSLYDTDSGKLEGKYKPNKNNMTLILTANKEKQYKLIIEGNSIEPIVKNLMFTDNDKEMNFELLRRIK